MERLPLALLVLLSLLSLVYCYDIGTGAVCSTAPFFPGHNLMGEGYDIVTLKRKGAYLIDVNTYMTPDDTCHLFKNTLQGNQVQKLPLSTVDLRAFTRCWNHVYGSTQSSVSEVVSHLTSQDSNDWKIGLSHEKFGNLEVGGTRSDQYKFATIKEKEDKFTYSLHRSTCSHYRYRVSDTPPLSSEFINDVSRLPSSYTPSTKAQYRRLIDTYGTHYIRATHSCLSLGINVGLGKSSSSTSHKSCTNFLQNKDVVTSYISGMHLHHTEVVGGNGWTGEFSLLSNDSQGYKTWLQSLKNHPDIVQRSLRLMSDLVPDANKRPHVKAAIEDYLKGNGIRKTSGSVCGANCCPDVAWRGRLVVTIVRAWNLKGDWWGKTESYAKMWYGPHNHRTRVIRSNDPTWNARYDLGQVDTHAPLKIEVWDEDRRRDDRLGSCSRYLSHGSHSFTCYAKRGGVEVRYTLTCDQHLTGDRCDQYKPTPSDVEVVSNVTSQDSNDWKIGLSHEKFGNLEVGGTRSDQYKFATIREKEDKFTYSLHRSTCSHYRYRVSDTPPLSSEFKNDVSRLPSSYNSSTKAQYRRLIDTYGTHYIRE